MERKDLRSNHQGIVRSSSNNLSPSSPGLYKFPRERVVPLKLSESVNTNKVLNTPEAVSLPVKAKDNILEKSKPDGPQKNLIRKNIEKKSYNILSTLSAAGKKRSYNDAKFQQANGKKGQKKSKKK